MELQLLKHLYGSLRCLRVGHQSSGYPLFGLLFLRASNFNYILYIQAIDRIYILYRLWS